MTTNQNLFQNAMSIEKLEARFEMEEAEASGSCSGSCPIKIVIEPTIEL